MNLGDIRSFLKKTFICYFILITVNVVFLLNESDGMAKKFLASIFEGTGQVFRNGQIYFAVAYTMVSLVATIASVVFVITCFVLWRKSKTKRMELLIIVENKDKEINRLFGLENSIREVLSDNYRRTVDFSTPGLDEKINESLVENSNNSKEESVDVISKIGGF
jgi:hypothetical protein